MTTNTTTPGIGRRLLSLVYEVLLLIAIVLLAGGAAVALAQITSPVYTRQITQIAVIAASAVYFAWQWHSRGQTLPMKTWRMRLVTTDGTRVPLARALLRTIFATAGYLSIGVSVLWALIDRDHQFLHDRLAGTRLITSN